MLRRRFGNLDSVGAGKASKDQFDRWREDRFRKLRNKGYGECVPSVAPDLRFLQHNRSEPSITWIGHSTFLIQMAGLNIVTDPVWARRMAFQKRLSPPGIELSDMPSVDVVLISHAHYDHLHVSSLRRLRGPKKMIVPVGSEEEAHAYAVSSIPGASLVGGYVLSTVSSSLSFPRSTGRAAILGT